MTDIKTILYCIIITELSMIGSLIMFGLPLDHTTGFIVWGLILAMLCYTSGMFSKDFEGGDAKYFTSLLNGCMVNMGGYFAIMVVLRIYFGVPIMINGM